MLFPALFGIFAIANSGEALAACSGPGAPASSSPIVCLTAIAVPGNPITSFDISFWNPTRNEYYLADRSNSGIDVVSTATNPPTFVKTIGGFVGCALNTSNNTCITSKSGPDGVTAHGKWLYAGDGDSTLKVVDLTVGSVQQAVPTGGSTRVDEMALTTDGTLLLAANNAEDPPFATLFQVNGDNPTNNIRILAKITVDTSLIPAGLGLSLEQPTWDAATQRFYVSVPQINYPAGCTPFVVSNPATGVVGCQGGMLVIDPKGVGGPVTNYGPFNASVNAGMLALPTCGPNGITVGPPTDSLGPNLLLGCTPANMPNDLGTLAINTTTKNFTTIGNITGSDEVWYNSGDNHYYTGSSANVAGAGIPALGIIDATSNILIGIVPEGSGSHSVAADAVHNFIFVPQVAPKNTSGPPGAGNADTTGVSAQLCGTNNGCIVVYLDQNPAVD